MTHSRWTTHGGPTLAHGEHSPFGRTKRSAITGPTGHLARLEAFDGHSMRAEWVNLRNTIPSSDKYYVYSYSTVIAVYTRLPGTGNGALYLNEYRYSSKTAEHQHMVEAWINYPQTDTHPVVICHDEDDLLISAEQV